VITWIIGQGGLLGSALARNTTGLYEPGAIPWHSPEDAATTLHTHARGLEAAAQGSPWRVIWAAGAATTSTTQREAEAEMIPLQGLLTGLRSALPSGPGAFFLASSAGGVYAGSQHPPFTSTTAPQPLSPYGELKLAQERLSSQSLGPIIPVTIGRISNLYGPGQNLDKLQGLISRLAMAGITRQPINIFVPLGTIRDYIYADDAAKTILQLTQDPWQHDRPQHNQVRDPRTEIIATGRGTTIGQLIRMMSEVTKRRVPVALGSHPSSAAQAEDLRVVPTAEPPSITTLPEGVRAVHDDLLTRLRDRPLSK